MTGARGGLTGEQVRAYRILASGLDRATADPTKLPVWDLGMQDRDGSARLALAARLADPAAVPDLADPAQPKLVRAGLVAARITAPAPARRPGADRRGALARRRRPTPPPGCPATPAGCWADGADPLEAFAVVADAMREVITAPMVKGEASAAVTAALPAQYSGFCPGCGSVHVRELLFRLAALPAGLGLVPDTKPIVLAPLVGIALATGRAAGAGRTVAAECYRPFGVGTPADVGAHLGTSATGIAPALPDDLVPVTVDGARSQVPASLLGSICRRRLRRRRPASSGCCRRPIRCCSHGTAPC